MNNAEYLDSLHLSFSELRDKANLMARDILELAKQREELRAEVKRLKAYLGARDERDDYAKEYFNINF